jgi:hypothetical protein
MQALGRVRQQIAMLVVIADTSITDGYWIIVHGNIRFDRLHCNVRLLDLACAARQIFAEHEERLRRNPAC